MALSLGSVERSMGKPQHCRKRGQATVELAFALILMSLLLVGVADVARIYSEHLAIVHAAGVGARWATLPSNQQGCSGYTNVPQPVLTALVDAVPTQNILAISTRVVVTEPRSVRVEVTYRHEFFFGLIGNVPGEFTGGATYPGRFSTPSTCLTVAPSGPTNTPITIITNTPVPATSTPTPTPVPPTATPTCVAKAVTGTACYFTDGRWRAEATISNYQAGDGVQISLCDDANPADCVIQPMNNAGGNRFTADGVGAEPNDQVKLTVTTGVSNICSVATHTFPLTNQCCPYTASVSAVRATGGSNSKKIQVLVTARDGSNSPVSGLTVQVSIAGGAPFTLGAVGPGDYRACSSGTYNSSQSVTVTINGAACSIVYSPGSTVTSTDGSISTCP